MYKEKLKKDYENACNAYLKAFCEKHEFYGLDNPETYWIGDQVGEIANCGDFTFDMATIVTDIDKDAPEEELLKWYDYMVFTADLGITTPNFYSWLLGCPRLSRQQLEDLSSKQSKIKSLKMEFDEMCKDASKNLVIGNKLI